MAFDPDQYLAEKERSFDPDAYLAEIDEPAEEDQGIRDGAILEAGRAIVSGGVRAVAGGLLGTASIPFRGMEGAADIVKDIQSNAFQPQTEGGKAAMQKIAELAKSGVDFANVSIGSLGSLGAWLIGKSEDEQQQVFEEIKAKGIGQFLGDETLETTGSPALATIARIAPEAGVSALGFQAGKIARVEREAAKNFNRSVRASTPLIDTETGLVQPGFQKALAKYDIDAGALIDDSANLPVIYSGDTTAKVVDSIVKKQIKTGGKSSYLAKLRLDKSGNIIADDLGTFAIKQGFDGGDVQSIKQANQVTRKEAQRMLRMQRAIAADKSKVDSFRPSDAVGDSVMNRVKYVRDEADNLSNKLNKMASKELTISGRNLVGDGDRLKGMPIDPTGIERAVFDGLDRLGVEGLDNIPNITEAILDPKFFDGSAIMVDKTSQRIIRDVFKLLKHNPDGPIDALRAHNVKRQIDSMIDFNKKSSQGLTESGRRFAKSIRAAMNDSIREVSPKYAKVNDDLSLALGAINDIETSVGRRIDLFDRNANQAIGTEMRKLLSNYGTRQTLNNSLNGIDSAANQLGGVFKTDFRELNRFANVLDKRFGSVAENSFKGNIDSSLDLNRLRNTSVKDAIVEKGLSKIADKFGPNDKKAMDTMQKILVRGK